MDEKNIILLVARFPAWDQALGNHCSPKQLASLTYENVEMSLVRDGMYYGETKAGLVSVQVEVLVQNHTIRGIEIVEHDNGLGRKAESITLAMMQENKWAVDAVSGATLSSEAIKSAVSKALGAAQME